MAQLCAVRRTDHLCAVLPTITAGLEARTCDGQLATAPAVNVQLLQCTQAGEDCAPALSPQPQTNVVSLVTALYPWEGSTFKLRHFYPVSSSWVYAVNTATLGDMDPIRPFVDIVDPSTGKTPVLTCPTAVGCVGDGCAEDCSLEYADQLGVFDLSSSDQVATMAVLQREIASLCFDVLVSLLLTVSQQRSRSSVGLR